MRDKSQRKYGVESGESRVIGADEDEDEDEPTEKPEGDGGSENFPGTGTSLRKN